MRSSRKTRAIPGAAKTKAAASGEAADPDVSAPGTPAVTVVNMREGSNDPTRVGVSSSQLVELGPLLPPAAAAQAAAANAAGGTCACRRGGGKRSR